MSLPRTLLLALLLVSSAATLAAPNNDKGQSQNQNQGKGQNQNQNQGKSQNQSQGKSQPEQRASSGSYEAPRIDLGRVSIILGENRSLLDSNQSLPPGVQNNLARGKPMPPGLGKRFDSRLQSRMPHYDGYEWQQVGRDVVLISISTGLIQEVLHDILD